MALLERNKAKAFHAADDDDTLEKAFQEASASHVPKKRTREDIIRELKEQRKNGIVPPVDQPKDAPLETAKQQGKFRPIGFKPIGQSEGKTRKKEKKSDTRKKKKEKSEEEPFRVSAEPMITSEPQVAKIAESLPSPREDFDIFQGVEEYDGLASEDDGEPDQVHSGSGVQAASGSNKWFLDEPIEGRAPFQARPSTPDQEPSVQANLVINEEQEEDFDEPIHLQPLASSAMPSITEFLALDDAAEKEEKKRKRKEKRKGDREAGDRSATTSAEAKADRDYKRFDFTSNVHFKR
jgi:IK cytokine